MRYVMIKKIELGQFFTKANLWLKPQIIEFIKNSNCKIAFDPFAGAGDMLKATKEILNFKEIKGLDIDSSLEWEINDSLISIPYVEDSITLSNPPYLAKQSASRKGINLTKYFSTTIYDDLYLIALDKILETSDFAVVIIPESFINSTYKQKNRLCSITILEENPFEDTENPVCVACFDKKIKSNKDIKIYKNDKYINTLEYIMNYRIYPKKDIQIRFNDKSGWLGLRAIDSTDGKTYIKFDFKENIKYDWNNKIKETSRHLSLINIKLDDDLKTNFIKECNELLNDIRVNTSDILLTPFKGNTKQGVRRRRLDFELSRAIMEKAYKNVNKEFCRINYAVNFFCLKSAQNYLNPTNFVVLKFQFL